ncbi:MAG TPA: hypothetical protein VGL63_11130 [Streptosporangiaceae bacterium]
MPIGPDNGSESLPDPFAVDEDELPAWIDPSPPPLRRPSRSSLRQGGGSEHGHDGRRPNRAGPLRPRARANRARRAKRRVYLWGGLAAAAAIIAALVVVLLPGSSGQTHTGDGFVSTFQPGEFRSVPGACSSVSNSTLTQYLPGPRVRVVPPSLSGNAQSQCDWTLDRKPVYRLLAVAAQAYAPNGLATGNGSATSAAKDAYGQAMLALAHPPKATHQPKASITPIGHLGTVAFNAFQVISVGGDTTDRDTVVIRLRNVMITVVFSGLAHARQGGYGPVTASQMMAGAVAAAGDMLGKVG